MIPALLIMVWMTGMSAEARIESAALRTASTDDRSATKNLTLTFESVVLMRSMVACALDSDRPTRIMHAGAPVANVAAVSAPMLPGVGPVTRTGEC